MILCNQLFYSFSIFCVSKFKANIVMHFMNFLTKYSHITLTVEMSKKVFLLPLVENGIRIRTLKSRQSPQIILCTSPIFLYSSKDSIKAFWSSHNKTKIEKDLRLLLSVPDFLFLEAILMWCDCVNYGKRYEQDHGKSDWAM